MVNRQNLPGGIAWNTGTKLSPLAVPVQNCGTENNPRCPPTSYYLLNLIYKIERKRRENVHGNNGPEPAMNQTAATTVLIDLPDPITGPSAWRGEDLQDHPQTWTDPLEATFITALSDLADRYLARNRPLSDMARDDMDHPALRTRVSAWQATLMHGRGFVLARGLPVDDWGITKTATAWYGLGLLMGTPRSQNAQGHLLGHVRDLGLSTDDPKVRIYQTTERQTFHTDSCDVVGLVCLKTAREGGESAIVSSMQIYNEMHRQDPELLRALFNTFPTDRRGEIPPGKRAWFDIPVFNHHAGHLSVIYARRYITSAARLEGPRRLSDLELAALDRFDALANDPAMHLKMEFMPGDMQFVHNHTILHDRLAYQDWPEPERKRHLLRLWLAIPGARPLPDVYAERYGSTAIGDRGGILVDGTRLTVPLEAV